MSSNTNASSFNTKLRKFDGKGFRVWARQLQLYLEVKDVWRAVLESAPTSLALAAEESGGGDQPLHQLEIQQKLAMIIVFAALSDDIAAEVAEHPRPKAMLDALQKTHRHLCDTTVAALKREYLSFFLEHGGDMIDHIRKTRLLIANLAGYKVVVSEGEKRSNFLQSLSPDWNGYVAAVEACTSFEKMLMNAASEAKRRANQDLRGRRGGSGAGRSGSAFAVMQAKTPGKKMGNCFKCDKPGHFKNERRSKQSSSNGGGSRNKEESGFVFQASEHNAHEMQWIVDSGASSHMTGVRELLFDVVAKSDVSVNTAGGEKLTAMHRGKALLPLVGGGSCTLQGVLFVPGLKRSLVSLNKAGEAGLNTTFERDACTIARASGSLRSARTTVEPLSSTPLCQLMWPPRRTL